MAKRREKPNTIATNADLKRLTTQSEELRRLTAVPAMKSLSPKRHKKLLTQQAKLDRVITKITKLVN